MFVKNDNGALLTGDNYIYAPTFTLTKEIKDEFTYPNDEWYWFDTIEEANTFFNINNEITLDGEIINE